ncbi:MAG TPA: AarF/ABC1/UbiB kinase family protein, partial [Desulfobulbaceae bacterium]|nr:AarF/ABC1/UbiB kinase family protein [Desulfobulbaceae bacterium]
ILKQIRAGHLKIEFEHRGLRSLGMTLDRVSNRVAFAIVLAAQIIGSSLIVLSGIPPKWHDIPIIGLAGFLLAGIMGFWLLLSIIRHGRL